MEENVIKQNFAKNVRLLRTKKHLTQEQLGEKLGYSDKAISKWECGQVMPDVYTLVNIAEFFSVTMNDLLGQKLHIAYTLKSRVSLILVSVFLLCLFLASLLFFVLTSFTSLDKCYLVYVYALPVFALVSLVLVSIYFGYKEVLSVISLFIVTVAVAIYFIFIEYNYWQIFLLAAIAVVFIVILGFVIHTFNKSKSAKQDIENNKQSANQDKESTDK